MKRKLITKPDIISVLLCLSAMLPGILVYGRLSDRIATNFDLAGEPAQYMSKAFTVFGMPLAVSAIQLVLCLASNFFFSNKTDRINSFIRFISPFALYVGMIVSLMYAMGLLKNVMVIFGCLYALICIITGNYMPKLRRNLLLGIRVPRTLKDQEIWDRTHRFAGGMYIFGGIMAIPVTLTGKYIALIAIALLLLIIPIIYSEMIYRTGGAKSTEKVDTKAESETEYKTEYKAEYKAPDYDKYPEMNNK
ncbi:MAG: SdpI family protein [Lachnospiraceae bacterium]|nr:SdpI family protein [Lachnospiraceae bacterium]